MIAVAASVLANDAAQAFGNCELERREQRDEPEPWEHCTCHRVLDDGHYEYCQRYPAWEAGNHMLLIADLICWCDACGREFWSRDAGATWFENVYANRKYTEQPRLIERTVTYCGCICEECWPTTCRLAEFQSLRAVVEQHELDAARREREDL